MIEPPLKSNKNIYLLLFLLTLFLLPDIIAIFLLEDCRSIIHVGYVLFNIALFGGIAGVLRNSLKVLAAIVLLLTACIGILSVGVLVFYKAPLNVNIISALINTNSIEAREFVYGYELEIGGFVLLFLALVVFIYRSIGTKIQIPYIRKYSAICLLMFGIGTALIIYHDGKIQTKNIKTGLLKESYPYYCFRSVTNYIRINRELEADLKKAEKFRFNATSTDTSRVRKIYVLIIGESSRYSAWSLNGYNRKTTPNLDTTANLIPFTDAIAGHNSTIQSLAMIITPVGSADYTKHSQQRSILQLFKEAGYFTYWISNQNDWSAAPIRIHMVDADSISCAKSALGVSKQYDEMILPQVSKALLTNRDVFLVVHLNGNHYQYSDRYPSAFRKFGSGSSAVGNYFDVKGKSALIDAYDNCTLYQDSVLKVLLNLVAAQTAESIVCFVSDHGEDLFDDCRNLSGHGAQFTSNSFRIPMFLWYNDTYFSLHPNEIMRIKEHKVLPVISGEDVFFTMGHLACLKFDQNDTTKALSSVGYSVKSKRTILLPDYTTGDYDQLAKEEQKQLLKKCGNK